MVLRTLLCATALAVVLPAAADAGLPANAQTAGLQVALRAKHVYTGSVDAIRGPATAKAVRVFQVRAGLTADGVAGRQTRAALGPLGRPLFGNRTIVRGDVGWDVSVLQFLLRRAGYKSGAVDGTFGARTEAAVRSYQRSLGLHVDGIVGRGTIAAFSLRYRVP
ncbi:MAG: hypothetical protein QOE91_475, partial [Gaiellaceae bacterium]|nr:hypothetical protein [Gaiellaceae bacterium]